MLRLSEVALLLRLHPNTVRAWADKGVLKAYRTGQRGTRRFRQDEVMRLISAGL
jgi:excisionase family DNA binding protein